MQIKRLAALSLAAMLTGCDLLAWLAWLEENSDSSSVTSSPSSSTSRPSYDDENDDDASSPPPAEPDPKDPKTWPVSEDGTLIVPAGTTSIPVDAANAFANKADITSLNLPEGLTSIGVRAFQDCTSLTSVTLPDSLISIGNLAFYNCTGLTSIRVGTGIIGDGMTIGVNAFDGVPNTVMVYYPKEWDADADKDDKLKAVQAKLASGGLQTNLSNYQPGNGEYTQPTQASPAVPDSAKKLLDAVRVFGM